MSLTGSVAQVKPPRSILGHRQYRGTLTLGPQPSLPLLFQTCPQTTLHFLFYASYQIISIKIHYLVPCWQSACLSWPAANSTPPRGHTYQSSSNEKTQQEQPLVNHGAALTEGKAPLPITPAAGRVVCQGFFSSGTTWISSQGKYSIICCFTIASHFPLSDSTF